ncbi:MAG: pilus assembly protein TadG-related protein [Cypionkella sp.]
MASPEKRASLRKFWGDEGGVVSASFVILLPMLLLAAGIAIDLTSIEAEKRYVQAQADLAALTAIRHYDTAIDMRSMARRTIVANNHYPTLPTPDIHIEIGAADMGGFQPAFDQYLTEGSNAVRVTVQAKAVVYIMQMFMDAEDLTISRIAVAAAQPRVSFSLSNCLLNADLLRPILEPLIGVQVDVLCSGRGIDARISGKSFLESLSTQASLLTPSGSDQTYGDILNAELPVSSVLGAALGIPITGGGQTIRLADVIYLAPDLRNIRVGQPLPKLTLKASDIAFASAELLGKRVADVQAAVTLPSIGTVQAKVTIGDPRQIVLGAIPGDPNAVARTSQIRVELPAVNIANLFSLTLALDVANASARLSNKGATCSQNPGTVVAVFDPVKATLVDLDLKLQVLGLPLDLSSVGKVVDAVAHSVQQSVSFTRAEATNAPVRTFGPTLAVDVDALASEVDATVASMLTTANTLLAGKGSSSGLCSNIIGCALSGTLSPITSLVNGILNKLTSAAVKVANATGLEGTLTHSVIEDVLGLKVAQAQLELLDAGCADRARLIQ